MTSEFFLRWLGVKYVLRYFFGAKNQLLVASDSTECHYLHFIFPISLIELVVKYFQVETMNSMAVLGSIESVVNISNEMYFQVKCFLFK